MDKVTSRENDYRQIASITKINSLLLKAEGILELLDFY